MTFKISDDREHMEKAAREALTRPSDYMAYDDRWYTTHGCVMSWADRSDDVLAESNYLTALAMLEGAVTHDESGASEERGDDVIDTSASHWALGSVRELFVRVYTDETETEFTPAFKEAVDIAAALESYPILDESDYSERETEAWDKVANDAIDYAIQDYPDDSDAERQAFYTLLTSVEDLYDVISHGEYHPDSVDYDTTAKAYADIRNEHFEWLAQRYCVPEWPYPLPGAEALPGL